MTVRRKNREIAKRILLKGRLRQLSAGDIFALFTAFTYAATDSRIGFNHVSTDIQGWLASVAPFGITLDEAFLEDLLYAGNMMDEMKKFRHPEGKTFQEMLKRLLRPGEAFDFDTNEIKRKSNGKHS